MLLERQEKQQLDGKPAKRFLGQSAPCLTLTSPVRSTDALSFCSQSFLKTKPHILEMIPD